MAIIEQPTEFRKKQYDQATPIPAKFLHSDGTVDENIGGGGTSLEYKLYAWEVSIDHTTIGYTEVEDVEVGDVLLIPENTGVGPITDTNQLKKKGLVTSVSENHITVEIEEGHEIVFERDSEDDWTETITDIKGTLDISQNGLLVAEKGKVMKSVDVNIEGALPKGKIYIGTNDTEEVLFGTFDLESGDENSEIHFEIKLDSGHLEIEVTNATGIFDGISSSDIINKGVVSEFRGSAIYSADTGYEVVNDITVLDLEGESSVLNVEVCQVIINYLSPRQFIIGGYQRFTVQGL